MRCSSILHTLCAMLLIFTASCVNDGHVVSTDSGTISIVPELSGDIAMADGSVVSVSADMMPAVSDLAMTLTAADGSTAEWKSVDMFDAAQGYAVGAYRVCLASDPVDGAPKFAGAVDFNVIAGRETRVHVPCAPVDALVRVSAHDPASGAIALRGISLHADGGGYREIPADGQLHDVYSDAGRQHFFATLADETGRTLSVALPADVRVEAAHGINASFSFEDGYGIRGLIEGTDIDMPVETGIFDCAAPEIDTDGFQNGECLVVEEGITLKTPVAMDVTAERRLQHVMLTIASPAVSLVDASPEIDLLDLSETDRTMLTENGLRFDVTSDGKSMRIDFTGLLETMASYITSRSSFTVCAQDVAGVCSEPSVLAVDTHVVRFAVDATDKAAVGIDRASVLLSASTSNIEREDISIYVLDSPDGQETTERCPVVDWETARDGRTRITFLIPSGVDAVPVGINYLGLRRATAIISRTAPVYEMGTDAYATNVRVQISADADSITRALTEYAYITVDGVRAPVWHRDLETGTITVTGLSPDRRYTLGVRVAEDTKTVTFHTETAAEVPSASFDDWKVLIDEKNVPCGGRYSTTSIAVVNRQNYTDFYVQWPKKHWASINAKTYYKGSTNHNSWYMQPSAKIDEGYAEGVKGIMISSVGWDHAGPSIPDYVQQTGQSLPYSMNVPDVAHRSAGRLFLGSYEYDAATGNEVFHEGVGFASRPISLNGYFKYIPDVTEVDDQGYVVVEIVNDAVGQETLIASGRMEFSLTPGYRAFSVPLTYSQLGVKPTRLRIMFASTTATGTQQYEDAHVPVSALPELGIMHGSTLWISNLTFSY